MNHSPNTFCEQGWHYSDDQVLPEWRPFFNRPNIQTILKDISFALSEQQGVFYPSQPLKLFSMLPPQKVRVIILGQDPYHGEGQAQGLAFSVPNGQKTPSSLRNIFLELQRSYPDILYSPFTDLTPWVNQGVFLFNTILTVQAHQPASHRHLGWEKFTNEVIVYLSQLEPAKVFLLWGRFAQSKQSFIDPNKGHYILQSNHPSGLSARRGPTPFIGCHHFKLTNQFLEQRGEKPIHFLPLTDHP